MTKLLVLRVAAILALAWSVPAGSQVLIDPVEDVDFDRPEAWAMKFFASINTLTGLGVPRERRAGEVELGLEVGSVPHLDLEQRTVGFNGRKEEDLNRTSVLVRPRLTVGLPAKLSLDAAWVPPVETNGVLANLFSVALARPLYEGDGWRLGLRLFGQAGTIEGDFTCSAEDAAAGPDPGQNPFFCEAPSEDEQEIRALGLELGATTTWGEKWHPHAALVATHMDLEFQVRALYSGLDDRTLLRTDGETYAALVGVTYDVARRWDVAGEIFYSPLDVRRPPRTPRRATTCSTRASWCATV